MWKERGDLLWLALLSHHCGPKVALDGYLVGETVHRAREGGQEGQQWGAGLEGLLCIFQPAFSLVAALRVEFPEAYLLGAKSLESDSQLGYKTQLHPKLGLTEFQHAQQYGGIVEGYSGGRAGLRPAHGQPPRKAG